MPPHQSGSGLRWLLVGVTGAALAAIVGYRIHLALVDRATAALPEPTVAASAAPASEVAAVVAGSTSEPPSTETPRANDLRVEHDRLVIEASRSVAIELYGAGWCASCQKARAWLDANSIPYTYRDTDSGANNRTMHALNPKGTIPTIDIDGQIVVGFQPQALRASIRRAAEARVAKSGP